LKGDSSGAGVLRIGAVSYLNTKPLIHDIEHISSAIQLTLDVPSRLADALSQGKLDVALIPSIECLRHPEYAIVSDACIACRGPVLSVRLLARKPMAEVRSIALDAGSRTSIALTRVLLRRCCGTSPQTVTLPLGESASAVTTDAVLVIGDRAIESDAWPFVEQWDLGQQWVTWCGLPFVFALWAARPGLDTTAATQVLTESRDRGVTNLQQIAQVEAGRLGMDVAACYSYLHDNLHFFFGAEERRGLELFEREARACDLLPNDDLTLEHISP